MRDVTTMATEGSDNDGGGERLLSGAALRMTVLLGESDRWHHKPVYTEIVHRAQRAGWPAPASSTASRASARRR